jgi:uncharacterized protein
VIPARALFDAAAPRSPEVHLLGRGHLFVVNGSRLYDIDEEAYASLTAAPDAASEAAILRQLGLEAPRFVDDRPLQAPPVRALSLAIAQRCNLGCTYCYAQGGDFGAAPRDMSDETAAAAVDLLFSEVEAKARVNLAFLGGEPLTNRALLREMTVRAERAAAARDVRVTFSITTNGTLLDDSDCAFFEEHGFAVTVSLDGLRKTNDFLRPYRGGRGSFDDVMRRVRPLLARQKRMQVSARVTVTPFNIDLRETLDAFVSEGFHSVGFSPLLSSPSGAAEMDAGTLATMLEQMVACGVECERRLVSGERYPFANLLNALKEIHSGTHRPYPCGAGAGYLGVSATGELAACHRFVNDPAGALGHVADGIDRGRRESWLKERHVHRQEPCRNCWARYLCGGGCHHEVIARGRPACDYIRGWLHYCLEAYLRISSCRPDWFGSAADG